jgi:hypothetical protein
MPLLGRLAIDGKAVSADDPTSSLDTVHDEIEVTLGFWVVVRRVLQERTDEPDHR